MYEKDQMFNRTKLLFVTRLFVLLDKYKEDFISKLVAESIQDAIKTLYPTNGGFSRVQRDNQKIVLDKILERIIFYIGEDNE